ncbi:glycosyltransferase family 9 protein [Candidatus Nitronereus thalassa]|uniref:Glycosyltransferase family 9 protein n=1 Tax=Candidatus Nitronereus thalassa TaxID=3020898 RepID=A0ABU3KCJ3_9BACT|nr:glycosyltransferase family 9 protein [Candidatus Nitronereus thalassa]MDT7044166.1 glycosyltransferase family 9 protein [Candidatus Nitronereus thalassa]
MFIIHPGTLGDVVLSLQALQVIRTCCPQHELVMLVRQEIGKVLVQLKAADRFMDMEGPVLSELLRDDPQLDGDSAEVLSRCDHVVAWMQDRDGRLGENFKKMGIQNRCIISPHDELLSAVHQADRYCESLEHWETENTGTNPSQLFPLNFPSARLKEGILDSPIRHEPQVFMVHYGSGSQHKCVSPERMGRIIRRLANAPYRKVILCQGPADAEMAFVLKPFINQVSCEILKDTELLCVMKVLRGVDVFVGHDSGLTHLAAALEVPTLALFGPTDHRRWGPRGAKVEILQGLGCQCQDWNAVQQCSKKSCLMHPIEEIVQVAERLANHSRKVVHFGSLVNTQ